MAQQVWFCVADERASRTWDSDDVSAHDLMKQSLLWAAGRFAEADAPYQAEVWIEDSDGDLLDIETVTIGTDGEIEFEG